MLIGYLGRDPEVKYSQQGTAIAQFSVATTERWKDKDGEQQEHTEWFAVKTFGRRAEIVGEHLHKGSRVYLEGRKRTEWIISSPEAKSFAHSTIKLSNRDLLRTLAASNPPHTT
jgi:single stranded DNA-binding protein